MDFSGEKGQLLGAKIHGLGRSVSFLIPIEDVGGGAENGDFAKEVLHRREARENPIPHKFSVGWNSEVRGLAI